MGEGRPSVLYALPYPRFFSQHAGVGGHVAHVYGILQGVIRAGYAVEVLAEEHHEVFDTPGVRVSLLPLGSSSLLRRQFWGVRLVRRLRRLSTEESRTFCYMRYSAGFTPWVPLAARALGATPLLLEVNSLGSQRNNWLRAVDRRALRAADLIVCVSDTLRDFITGSLDPALADRIVTVPNGVDPSRFRPSAEPLDGPSNGVHFGFAGLLKPDYGLLELVDAVESIAADHPEMVLHIYGDGPYRDALTARLESVEVGRGRMHLHDPIPFLRMPAILAGLDVLVYTTSEKYRFQSPIKLLEYMSAGKPIVAAATPQVRRLLGDGALGYLFETGNGEDMAAAFRAVLGDLAGARDKGHRARAAVLNGHTWDHRTRDILDAVARRSSFSPLSGLTGQL